MREVGAIHSESEYAQSWDQETEQMYVGRALAGLCALDAEHDPAQHGKNGGRGEIPQQDSQACCGGEGGPQDAEESAQTGRVTGRGA